VRPSPAKQGNQLELEHGSAQIVGQDSVIVADHLELDPHRQVKAGKASA